MLNNLFSPSLGPTHENLSGQGFCRARENDPKAVVVDVRSVMEFKSGRLPGAKNIDDPRFLEKILKRSAKKNTSTSTAALRRPQRPPPAPSPRLPRPPRLRKPVVNMSGGVMIATRKLRDEKIVGTELVWKGKRRGRGRGTRTRTDWGKGTRMRRGTRNETRPRLEKDEDEGRDRDRDREKDETEE